MCASSSSYGLARNSQLYFLSNLDSFFFGPKNQFFVLKWGFSPNGAVFPTRLNWFLLTFPNFPQFFNWKTQRRERCGLTNNTLHSFMDNYHSHPYYVTRLYSSTPTRSDLSKPPGWFIIFNLISARKITYTSSKKHH